MRLPLGFFLSALACACLTQGQLDTKFKAKGKAYFGASTNGLGSSASEASIITSQFGAIVPKNANWDSIEPTRGSFNFGGFDTLVNSAQSRGKLVIGRALIWHSRLPAWVSSINDAATLTTVIQNHITTIVGRYKGKIYAWEVVHEPFNEDGTLRSSVFANVLGESFISIAFKAARAADPSAKLYISDYNLDSVNAKVNALVSLVNRQKASGVPIDGIGSESHLSSVDSVAIQAALTKLASTGCNIALTELDITGAPSAGYAGVVQACLNVSSCIGISTSGVCDSSGGWSSSGSSSLLFDNSCQKKPAYNAIISLLS